MASTIEDYEKRLRELEKELQNEKDKMAGNAAEREAELKKRIDEL